MKSQRPGLATWPITRLADLSDEINRFFDSPLATYSRASQLLGAWTPPLDLHENKDSFVIKAELPGVSKEDVNVSIQDGTLTISGERRSEAKSEDTEVHHTERFFGRFQRTVTLPTAVAADKVKAQYKDGILTVTLPKTEEAKPKQIDVSIN
ncbi:MAG: Hsp20/alpha crystallin family protein [Verrucomicrobiota bacterium]